MEHEHGMMRHLRHGWWMAKFGFVCGMVGFAAQSIALLVGVTPELKERAIDWAGVTLIFAVAGALYSFFLPASVHEQSGPTLEARFRAAARAALGTGGVAVPLVYGGVFSKAVFMVFIFGLVGPGCGLWWAYSRAVRDGAGPGSQAGTGSGGESPRMVERP
jgi:hypothetical protein